MQCPACHRDLRSLTVEGISVDACTEGCGGIWFDRFELQRVDEPQEAAGEDLLQVAGLGEARPDPAARLECPRCQGQTMTRHFHSVKRQVQVDECPRCGGFWLDVGELRAIRTQFASDEERQAAAREYFQEVFGDRLEEMRAASAERGEQAQRIARAFRFLCPSYYIPGEQTWGAF